ncbi:MAG: molybdenum cofactor guanylyltransferase [Candidatus Hydrothermarchaeales archaeon]
MISCIVLAGGKSERMGRDKRLIKVKGKYLLERVLEAAGQFSDDVILSLCSKEQLPADITITAPKIALDELPLKSPLVGILSGLRLCSNEYAAVVPCDSPFLKPGVFQLMAEEARGHDAVVPKRGDLLEPLHAVYNVQAMIAACEAGVKADSLGVSAAIARLEKVKYIPIEAFKGIDEKLLTFYNVNYPEDLNALEDGLIDDDS